MSNHNFSIEGRALAEPKIYETNPDGTARSYAVELLTFMGDRPTVLIESDGRRRPDIEMLMAAGAIRPGDVIRFTGSIHMRPDLREGAAPGATAEMPVAETAKIYHQ